MAELVVCARKMELNQFFQHITVSINTNVFRNVGNKYKLARCRIPEDCNIYKEISEKFVSSGYLIASAQNAKLNQRN
jgi:hypothetical protein